VIWLNDFCRWQVIAEDVEDFLASFDLGPGP
jgi:hypothetical protein